jgi:acetyltransferase-like isoleucine patch superfamily enzyme
MTIFPAVPRLQSRWKRLTTILASYGIVSFVSLGLDVIYTRLRFPDARLVRHPIHIRGRQFTDFGVRLTTGRGCRIDAFSSKARQEPLIKFGADVQINDYVHIAAVESVTICNHVLIASRVFISDHNHGAYSGDEPHSSPDIPPTDRPLSSAPVVIEENVWIGESASILAGVTIGRGAIIGAQSVVNRSIPAFCIAAGAPARILKTYNFDARRWIRA